MDFVHKSKKIILLLFISIGIITVIKIFSQPGTQQDPIMSRSYVEKFFHWNKILLDVGQKIEISPNTSFILYLGEYTGEGLNVKILDLTEGREITNIEKIKKNHLLLLIGDNQLTLKAKKSAIIFIRGKHKVSEI